MSKTISNKKSKIDKGKRTAVRQADSSAGGLLWLKPWMMVAIVLALTAAVRIRLLGIPLERDEGEYAYVGQLLLHGIPPYKLAYSLKFPGIDAAYAAIMAVFGQTIIGIHFGFLLVNAATIVLMYLLGKRLFSPAAGVMACAAYALLSLGEGVLGTQAHATHFVVLAALGGTLMLLRGIDNRRWSTLLWSGVLYGIAVLMKQHGALFVVFGAAYLAWHLLTQRRDAWRTRARDLAAYLCGVTAPLALTGLALWWAGVFDKFWFWTFTYARTYEREMPFSIGMKMFQSNFAMVVWANMAIWIVALVGLVLIWWKRKNRATAVFLTGFLFFSCVAVCLGLYFRQHYFVLVLPAIALLSGAAVSTAAKLWPRFSWLAYGAFGAVLIFSVVQQKSYLFHDTPIEISRVMYRESPFPEAIKIADYIRMHSTKDARIAVLGSEPEIPFYANRRSATAHIYMFGLTEPEPYALDMQNEFIHDVETAQPDYVVFVTCKTSWIQFTKISTLKILDWWATYQPRRYKKIVGVADIISPEHTEYRWGDFGTYQVMSDSAVLIYKRTDSAEDEAEGLNPAAALRSQKKLEYVAQVFRQVFAITLQPDNYIAYSNLGVILDQQGLHELALKQFHHSLEIRPDQATAHYQIGRIFVEMQQYPEAIEEFNEALQYEPANADVHNDLGVALFQMGDYKKAAEQFSEEIRLKPANADAKQYLANAQAQLKK